MVKVQKTSPSSARIAVMYIVEPITPKTVVVVVTMMMMMKTKLKKKKKWGGGEKKNNNLFKIVYRNSVIPVSVYKFTSIYIYPLAYTLTTTYVTFFLHASVSFKLYMWVCARVYVCVCMRVCTLSKL